MDVFLMVRRKKTTIFLDAKENSTVGDLKKMIEGITKKSPADQQLYNKEDAGKSSLQKRRSIKIGKYKVMKRIWVHIAI